MVDRLEAAIPGEADASNAVVPALIAHVYDEASHPLRLKLLSLLLRPVGPLALAAIASGAFASFLHRRTWQASELSIEDASRITGEHILELARYVEQANPDLIAQVGSLVECGLPRGDVPV